MAFSRNTSSTRPGSDGFDFSGFCRKAIRSVADILDRACVFRCLVACCVCLHLGQLSAVDFDQASQEVIESTPQEQMNAAKANAWKSIDALYVVRLNQNAEELIDGKKRQDTGDGAYESSGNGNRICGP